MWMFIPIVISVLGLAIAMLPPLDDPDRFSDD